MLRLPRETRHVVFGELPELIADALWPYLGDGDERLHCGAAMINLEAELPKAVAHGELRVLDPLTLGPHTMPSGAALNRALVPVEDLAEWLRATRGMSLEIDGGAGAPLIEAAPSTGESPTDRRARRLTRFRELGGDLRPAGEGWQLTGRRGALADLAREEAGRPMSTRQDVSRDLRAAMKASAVQVRS